MEPPATYYWDESIDRTTPKRPAKVQVELPFWLLVEDGYVVVRYADQDWKILISSEWVEVYDGNCITDSKANCIYFGSLGECANELKEAINSGKLPFRKCKTVFVIDSLLNGWVHDRLGECDRRISQTVELFLIGWCMAHIPLLNLVIQKYRLATYDYYVYEISPRDTPIWFVRGDNGAGRVVPVYPYETWDQIPLVRNDNGTTQPLKYTTLSEIDMIQDLTSFSPAEFELMDAIGLMERGDYSSAIRRLYTAIEVIVEENLGRILLEKYGESEKHRFLKETRLRFKKRVERLCQETGLIWGDYENSLLDEIRELRRQIVHCGYRIPFSEKGTAQKLIDQGRWLFNKIEGNSNRATIREKLLGMRSLGRQLWTPFFDELTSPYQPSGEHKPTDGTPGSENNRKVIISPFSVNSCILDDRLYLSVRQIARAFGFSDLDIMWDAKSENMSLRKGGRILKLDIGCTTATVNDVSVDIETPPRIISGEVMLPAKSIAILFGAEAEWDPDSYTIVFRCAE